MHQESFADHRIARFQVPGVESQDTIWTRKPTILLPPVLNGLVFLNKSNNAVGVVVDAQEFAILF